MFNWGRAADLLAETIREVGVLILVFAPLEAAFAETAPGTLFLSIMLVLGVGLIVSGILVGRGTDGLRYALVAYRRSRRFAPLVCVALCVPRETQRARAIRRALIAFLAFP